MYQGQIKKLQKVAGFENVERDVLTWRAIPSTKRYFSYSREAFNKKKHSVYGIFHNGLPPRLWKKNIFSTRDFRHLIFVM